MWEDQGAVHVKKDFFDMLKSQMSRNSYFGEFLLADFVHTVYMYMYVYIATSNNPSVVNTICISSFRYTHVITYRRFQLK